MSALALLASVTAADVILQTHSDTLTTYRPGKTKVQDARPRVEQRGVNLDGSLRRASTHPLAVAGNPFERVWSGEAELNGVRLDTGTYSPSEVDISLPATVAWVIGRSFNSRQDNSGQYDADGYQGFNWFQSSQPEIVYYDDATDTNDAVYLVYGADRYVEFVRSGSGLETYKAKNGAAGVFLRTDASPDTWAYYAPDGNVATFFGFDTSDADHQGQLWKVTNPNGDVAYVGSTSSASSAISAGYDSDGRITQAYDSAGRGFAYAYSSSTIGGKKRLESVIVTASSAEVARVEYGYYPDSPSPSFGDPGDLRTVTTTTPLSDSGVNDIRVQYYRYYEGSYHAATNRGYQHGIMLVLDHEGARKYDWTDTTFDSDFLTETTANLKEYASVYFEYDTSRRVDVAWFNGQCGCGSAGSGAHAISYATNGSYSDGSGYDTAWCRRTVVDQPDSLWVSQYFDEVGQPLSRIQSDGDPSGSPTHWPTRVARDSMGCVDEIGTPASVTTYTHSSGSFSNAATGLVRAYDRLASGDLTGFLEHERWRNGSGGSEYFLRSNVWWTNKATRSIGSGTPVVLVRPLVKEAWEYPVADTDDFAAAAHKTAYDYTTYSGVSEPLAIEEIETVLPAVTTGNNGSGSGHLIATHLKRDGRQDFKAQSDGTDRHVEYRAYTNGLVSELRKDANTTSLSPPTDFEATGESIKNDATVTTFDAQGRALTVTDPGGRVSKTYHSKLADRRLVTIQFPRFVSGSSTYYGPAQLSVTNHAGKVEASGVIAISASGSTSATTAFVDESDSDIVTAIDTGSSFGSVAQLRTHEYDKSGTQLSTERAYFAIPTSLPGTDGTHYDATTYGYDDMGRRRRTKAAHSTIDRTVYDVRGQVTEHWIGTNDYSFAGGESSGPDNMVKTSATAFDTNGYVTSRTSFVQDSTTGQRVTTYTNDLFGRPLLVANPTAPHTFVKLDNLGRQTASAQFSSTASIVLGTDDPTTETANRLALSRSYYDERGRIWKSTRHKIDDADGSDDDNLESLTWYDKLGRVAKSDGETLEKFKYDRLNRTTHHYVLASVDSGEDTYAEMIGVASDIVLEERQTTFDVDGHVLMEAVISRFYNDTGGSPTTGALDTNGDSDALVYTSGNVLGRIQITAKWYDAWDRLEEVVQYGTNDTSANVATFTRTSLTVPARSDTVLRTSYVYNTDGTLKETTDPKGLVTRNEYDALGRRTKAIANYGDGVIGDDGGDDDQTVVYAYTDGLQVSITADLPSGETDQVTTYTFGTTKGSSGPDSKIATGHLLKKVQYPDSSDATNDIVAYAYNAQGQEIWKRDQATSGNNSDYNVLETEYDTSGRVTDRKVTQLRAATDDYVQRIQTTYDSLGRASLVTQHSAPTSGSVRDEVNYVYDGWGNLTNFRQDKDSAVGGSGYWEVAHAYTKATDGRNTVRRSSTTLPGATTYSYNYRSAGGLHDADASRVSQINDPYGNPVVTYQYNGVGDVVRTTYPEPALYAKMYSTGTTFTRLDRFGRTKTSSWTRDLSTDRDIYSVTFEFDRNSNTTSQDDGIHTGHDVVYSNDNLNRLTGAQEGTWTGSAISSETREQKWTLNQTGNWKLDEVDLNGDSDYVDAGELYDDRTHNAVNELTARDTDDNGTDNYTFAYDAAGNMIDDGQSYTYVWDAFHRLRKVKNRANAALVREYWYNGAGHLVTRHQDTDTDGDVDGSDKKYHSAYDERWRVVATYRDNDGDPKEQVVHHASGTSGLGGSSYIDLVVMRDRDANTGWTSASDGVLEERVYYCQNWHADVAVLVKLLDPDTAAVAMLEWVKYSAYGIPFGMPMGDSDSDGDCDPTDDTQVDSWKNSGPYDVRGDTDLDGDVDATDYAAVTGGHQTLARNILSSNAIGNTYGYAGYSNCFLNSGYHVRNRTYFPMLGRWASRDPMEYLADKSNYYAYVFGRPNQHVDPSGLLACGDCTSEWINGASGGWTADPLHPTSAGGCPTFNAFNLQQCQDKLLRDSMYTAWLSAGQAWGIEFDAFRHSIDCAEACPITLSCVNLKDGCRREEHSKCPNANFCFTYYYYWCEFKSLCTACCKVPECTGPGEGSTSNFHDVPEVDSSAGQLENRKL